MSTRKANRDASIGVVHTKGCRSRTGAKCNCDPSWRVQVWDPRLRKLHRKTFRDRAEAVTYRDDVRVAMRTGAIRPQTRETVRQAADALIDGMRDGRIRNRSGHPYKPSATRSYERSLRLHVLPVLGDFRLADVERKDVQDLVERLTEQGLSASSVCNALDGLRVIYRRAIRGDQLSVDPTNQLDLPASDAAKRKSVDVRTAEALVAAAPARDRAFWSLAFHCSLRRGELRALRVSDVELRYEGEGEERALVGVLRVTRTWDDEAGEVSAKTAAGERSVPLMGPSAELLNDHLLDARRTGSDLAFGATAAKRFDPSAIQDRADKAWRAAGLGAARLSPHGMRHSGYNFLRLAGVSDYQRRTVFGHSDGTVSDDLYGAILPAELDAIRQQANAYLEGTS